MTFLAKAERGSLKLGEPNRTKLHNLLLKNEGRRVEIKLVEYESKKMRGFFEGAVVPLVTFYQHNMDYRDSDDLDRVRQWLKLEFNGEMVVVGGKSKLIAKSTKGKLNEFLTRVTEWLIENYAPPIEAIDPNKFKYWRDCTNNDGRFQMTYLEYLIEINVLRK